MTGDTPLSQAVPPSLEDARIPGMPAAAYYIPNFISEDEERALLARITSAPKHKWKQLTHRRLQTWPSELIQNRVVDESLPDWLIDPVIARLTSIPLVRDSASHQHIFSDSPHHQPNHVLVNEYPPGVGIMPHKDGPAYHPVVATVSLGASIILDIHKNKDDGALDPKPAYRILQEPRSLLVTTRDLYTDFLHGIADVVEDANLSADTVANWDMLRSYEAFADGCNQRAVRASLTYRDVIKVTKLGNKFAMFQRK